MGGKRARGGNKSAVPTLPEQVPAGTYVIGVDEVGRGPLAGPLVACAAWIRSDEIARLLQKMGVRDSKLLTPAARKRLSEFMRSTESMSASSKLGIKPEISRVSVEVGDPNTVGDDNHVNVGDGKHANAGDGSPVIARDNDVNSRPRSSDGANKTGDDSSLAAIAANDTVSTAD